ncbi:MAG: glycosyl hydrolase family 18 protein [Marinilabiliales bacterium]|nr:glycosyl hydrolase family 18 protein [Marinilabiliales bacterium]
MALKEINPDLKVLVSVGGWGWSGNFSDAALTDSSTKPVCSECCCVHQGKYRLTGLTSTGSIPTSWGQGHTYRPEDIHNFTLMLEACVRKHIDSLASRSGPQRAIPSYHCHRRRFSLRCQYRAW